mgnify:CR=1 FL=1
MHTVTKIASTLTALTLLGTAVPAVAGNIAGAIGLTQVSASVSDPDGSTGDDSQSSASLILTYNIDSQWRVWVDVAQYELDLEYGQSKIGQHVETLQVDTILQRAFPLGSFVYGWIGGGVGIGFSDYTERAKTLDTGHIDPDNKFKDRDETNYHAIVNAGILRGLNKNVTLGANLKHQITLNDGIDATSLTGYVSYQF